MPKKRHPNTGELADSELYLSALGNLIDQPGDRFGLSEWRDDVDREPVRNLVKQTLHDYNKGGHMSFEELGAQFAGLKEQLPHEQLQAVYAALGQLRAAGVAIIGENVSANWQARVSEVQQQTTSLMQSVEELGDYIEETAGRIRNQQL